MALPAQRHLEGRIERSWRLTKASWHYLRDHPRLFVLPALAAVATTIAAVIIFTPVLWALQDTRFALAVFVASTAAALPFALISTFFNVGFLAMVLAFERGEEPTVRDGLGAARARWRPILAWSLLSAVVGVVISSIERIPGGEWLANLLSFLGGLAWAMATFFVVPVLALDGTGPIESIRRSARTFRERWGEALAADVGIGAVFGLLSAPGCLIVGGGALTLEHGNPVSGIVVVAIGLAVMLPPLIAGGALVELFTMQLYRYSRGEEPGAPYTEWDLRTSFEPRQPPWWRRLRD